MRISKNILFRTVPFDASDCHALELYLSEMAAKGWMLDEIWILNIFKFKRCEPKNMRFTVDIPKLSDTCADTSLQNYELLTKNKTKSKTFCHFNNKIVFLQKIKQCYYDRQSDCFS